MKFLNTNLTGFKKLSGLILVLLSFNLHAANIITLSASQIDSLGIKIGKLKPVAQIPLLNAPAKVVIPPEHEAIISTTQAGLVTALKVSVGDPVKKNQLLAQINSPDVLNLQQHYLQVESQRQLAYSNYQRDKKLLDEGIIPQRRWQETSSLYNSLVAEVDSLKQLLQIAGMSSQEISRFVQARRFNSQLNFYAPMDGVILETMATVGERLASFSPLYKVANIETVWLEIAIPQEQIHKVSLGDKVVIAQSGITATITRLGKQVNATNQSIIVRAVLQNSPQNTTALPILSGQQVNVQLIQAGNKPMFLVPNTAIAQDAGRAYLFVRNNSGFEIRAIQLIAQQATESIISGELNGLESIALSGAVTLKANWLGLGSIDE